MTKVLAQNMHKMISTGLLDHPVVGLLNNKQQDVFILLPLVTR